jgi:hypothetical protein
MGLKLPDIKAELRKGVFEKTVLRGMFGNKRDRIIECWGNCLMRNFITCALQLELGRQGR